MFCSNKRSLVCSFVALTSLLSWQAGAQQPLDKTLTVAVASNFSDCLNTVLPAWRQHVNAAAEYHGIATKRDGKSTQAPPETVAVRGSTGRLYAQIFHGAPFDVLLAADVQRPLLLEKNNLAVRGSRFTYAVGRLALVSRKGADLAQALAHLPNGRLAIANPRLAPYGVAAEQVLKFHGLHKRVKLIRGENVAQVWQFFVTGNVDAALVAESQVVLAGLPAGAKSFVIPQAWHAAVEQQAVQLTNKPVAAEFLRFLRSPQGLREIAECGYAAAAT